MKKLLTLAAVAALSAGAYAADECKVVIEGNDSMQYNIDNFEIDTEACAEFTIELKHVGSLPKAAMGHNVVISKTEDFQAVANDSIAAGVDHDYIKPEDDRIIAHTGLIGGGESTEITFSTEALAKDGEYTFFCSFPGHSAIMNGTVTVK
ncbi:azurin [Suttonella sp. R2A3]|uniref:azurin n=1 Tax=Suttonella sp. R2A3 TaxID=2908648 RepID=UPI001F3FC896|nr:azurin [Suttonella sp. R2A3]UJF24042.1 azurin [Suttonella sp. R2A3]